MTKAAKTRKKTAKGSPIKKQGPGDSSPPVSQLVDASVDQPGDWRGQMLARARTIIMQADPEIIEEVKWRKPSNGMRGVPVWSRPPGGIICTGETYKNAVKLTFAKGASLDDTSRLFNASLEGGTRRAIDFHEGDKINEKGLKALVRAAIAFNTPTDARPARSQKKTKRA